jgi:general secretion pathway protein A
MYNAWWGLEENPFSLSPDPAFFYRSQQHEEAFANLIYGVESRKGFIALTGEVGTGKTTVLECLRDFLRERYIGYITISNSRLSVPEFFELIAYELRCGCSSKPEVLFTLSQLLVQEAEAGRTIVLIVDEAQNLERDVLEEIRLLGNLEDRHGKLLQIVLAGQPELDRKLDAPDLRQLKQRLALRCRLRPLTKEETTEYVAARLERAGMPHQTVFPPEVLDEIHRLAQGVPRVINAICDNLLLMTSARGERVATTEMLAKVSEEMGLDECSGSHQAGPVADPSPSECTRTPRVAPPEAMIAPAAAASVALKERPARARREVSFRWIAVAVVVALVGLTLVAANDLWRPFPVVPNIPTQPTWTEPTPSPAPLRAQTPRIETPPATPQSRPYLKAKADPPPAREPAVRSKAPAPKPIITPAPQPEQTVASSPSIVPATTQSEPAPRHDPEVVVDSKPTPPAVAPTTPAAPPSRYAGGWSYPSHGHFYGAEPEFVEVAIREDNGHLMGGLSVRFKPGAGRELLQFGFGGDLRSASIQTFEFATRNGDKGTIELIPGDSPNTLEVNFHAKLSDGKTQSGNMILVKKATSTL